MFLVRRVSLSAFFLPHSRRDLRKVHIRFGSCTVLFPSDKVRRRMATLVIDTAPPMIYTCSSSLQLCKAAVSEGNTSAPGHCNAGLEEITTFLRFGNAPFGSDSKVFRPITMVFPVVNALKRFKSLGSQNKSLFWKPIALRRSRAAIIDILLILSYSYCTRYVRMRVIIY